MELKTNKEYSKWDQTYYVPTFKRYPIALERGEGCRVWDVEGTEYLDALAGIAVNNLGHCHPAVVTAIQKQAEKLIHISNFYVSEPQVRLSQKLVELSGLNRVFFTNSGAESVEGAMKFARKYAHKKGRGGKVISMKNSFHGRTLATIATGKKAYQEGFHPIPKGFISVPLHDMDQLEQEMDKNTAAVIVEPIQGEGGIHPADARYIEHVRKMCDDKDVLLIFDEIQCGMGRTGKMFAKEHYSVEPDIVTLAKGLGAGVPIGAILINEKVSDAIDFGDHGTTFGGNPLVCAASLAAVNELAQPEFLQDVLVKGNEIMQEVNSWTDMGVKEVRGIGLMIGIEFEFETKPLALEMLHRKVLSNATAGHVLRLVP
ncbi:MAG: acetylornithine/succinylornithine family transaminase, partial [Bacteroidetes bacterium]|nr:acetylornithine/succinylornithine family transaminase [Bacteroidota bacterium]